MAVNDLPADGAQKKAPPLPDLTSTTDDTSTTTQDPEGPGSLLFEVMKETGAPDTADPPPPGGTTDKPADPPPPGVEVKKPVAAPPPGPV
ncbi:MAG: hypothetical protein K2X93_27115, partial [Candidatus Obscuribacterales bacterium]|nr:hypothetical protein [Candidatus Obscuribacterales bacterium]